MSNLHSDSLGEELVGEVSDHGDSSTFSHTVVYKHWWTGIGDLRGGNDDGDVRHSGSGEEVERLDGPIRECAVAYKVP